MTAHTKIYNYLALALAFIHCHCYRSIEAISTSTVTYNIDSNCKLQVTWRNLHSQWPIACCSWSENDSKGTPFASRSVNCLSGTSSPPSSPVHVGSRNLLDIAWWHCGPPLSQRFNAFLAVSRTSVASSLASPPEKSSSPIAQHQNSENRWLFQMWLWQLQFGWHDLNAIKIHKIQGNSLQYWSFAEISPWLDQARESGSNWNLLHEPCLWSQCPPTVTQIGPCLHIKQAAPKPCSGTQPVLQDLCPHLFTGTHTVVQDSILGCCLDS